MISILCLLSCQEKEKEFDATGTFETTEVTVSAKAAGELVSFTVEEGVEVSADDVVGNIETTQLLLQRNQLETQDAQLDAGKSQLDAGRRQLDTELTKLDTDKSQLDAGIKTAELNRLKVDESKGAAQSQKLDVGKQLASLRQQIANEERELTRFTELYNDGAVARKQVDDIQYKISVLRKELAAKENQLLSANAAIDHQTAGMEIDKKSVDYQIDELQSKRQGMTSMQEGIVSKQASIDAQKAALDAQKAGLGVQKEQVEENIRNTVVRCPLAGTVIEKYVEQGEYMTAGKPMFKIADTANMILRAYVTSSQLESVKVGQEVKVITDYGNNQGRSYKGVVRWISDTAEFTPKTIVTEDERADLVYAVKIAVKNDGGIKIGMYGKLKL